MKYQITCLVQCYQHCQLFSVVSKFTTALVQPKSKSGSALDHSKLFKLSLREFLSHDHFCEICCSASVRADFHILVIAKSTITWSKQSKLTNQLARIPLKCAVLISTITWCHSIFPNKLTWQSSSVGLLDFDLLPWIYIWSGCRPSSL